jgi:hypothetical protein
MGSDAIRGTPDAMRVTSQTPFEKPTALGVKQVTASSFEVIRAVVYSLPLDSKWHWAPLKVKAVPLKVKDILREFHSCVVLGVNDVKKGQVDVPLEHPPLPY